MQVTNIFGELEFLMVKLLTNAVRDIKHAI